MTDQNRVVLNVFVQSATGAPLAIEAIEAKDAAGVSVELDVDGGAVLAIDGGRDRSFIEFGLANGQTISTELGLPGDGAAGISMREVLDKTFTAQTEKLVFASDAEASKLIQAVARVTT